MRNDRQWAPEASHVPAVLRGESEQTAQSPHGPLWRAVILRYRAVPVDGQRKPKKVAGTFRGKVPATFYDRPIFRRSTSGRISAQTEKGASHLSPKGASHLDRPAEVDDDRKNLQYKE